MFGDLQVYLTRLQLIDGSTLCRRLVAATSSEPPAPRPRALGATLIVYSSPTDTSSLFAPTLANPHATWSSPADNEVLPPSVDAIQLTGPLSYALVFPLLRQHVDTIELLPRQHGRVGIKPPPDVHESDARPVCRAGLAYDPCHDSTIQQ
jgi:hypothetical protein